MGCKSFKWDVVARLWTLRDPRPANRPQSCQYTQSARWDGQSFLHTNARLRKQPRKTRQNSTSTMQQSNTTTKKPAIQMHYTRFGWLHLPVHGLKVFHSRFCRASEKRELAEEGSRFASLAGCFLLGLQVICSSFRGVSNAVNGVAINWGAREVNRVCSNHLMCALSGAWASVLKCIECIVACACLFFEIPAEADVVGFIEYQKKIETICKVD